MLCPITPTTAFDAMHRQWTRAQLGLVTAFFMSLCLSCQRGQTRDENDEEYTLRDNRSIRVVPRRASCGDPRGYSIACIEAWLIEVPEIGAAECVVNSAGFETLRELQLYNDKLLSLQHEFETSTSYKVRFIGLGPVTSELESDPCDNTHDRDRWILFGESDTLELSDSSNVEAPLQDEVRIELDCLDCSGGCTGLEPRTSETSETTEMGASICEPSQRRVCVPSDPSRCSDDRCERCENDFDCPEESYCIPIREGGTNHEGRCLPECPLAFCAPGSSCLRIESK